MGFHQSKFLAFVLSNNNNHDSCGLFGSFFISQLHFHSIFILSFTISITLRLSFKSGQKLYAHRYLSFSNIFFQIVK